MAPVTFVTFIAPRALLAAFCAVPLAAAPALAQAPNRAAAQAREWTPAQVQEILDKTQTTRLAPSLAHLSAGERTAVANLLEVGRIFQNVFEAQRHRGALAARDALARRTDAHGRNLGTLYRLYGGPIATTLDNRREPFVALENAPPGKNVYPWDLTKAEFDAYLTAHPAERASLTHLRSSASGRAAPRSTLCLTRWRTPTR
jgi:hypothetical protein